MAQADVPFFGSFGGFSVYKMRGTDKTVIRRSGGPSDEKMKTAPTLEPQRNQQTQLGGSSTTARMIGDAMSSVKHLQDFPLHGHFVKLNSAILKMDMTHPFGKQSIIFSRGLHLFEGLSLNRKTLFDSVVTTSIGFSISREEHKAVVQLPELAPGLNFNNPWKQPFYRFRVNLGIVRDMVYVKGNGYEPLTADLNDQTIGFDTEWVSVKIPRAGQEIVLQLDNPSFDEHCHLLLSIGIEFGAQTKGPIEHVKYAGCAKVLTMK